jgi:hypothetical protein
MPKPNFDGAIDYEQTHVHAGLRSLSAQLDAGQAGHYWLAYPFADHVREVFDA